mgnify:CR=1 FL=1
MILDKDPLKTSLIGILGTGISYKYSYPRTSLLFLGICWGGLLYDSIQSNNSKLGNFLNDKLK